LRLTITAKLALAFAGVLAITAFIGLYATSRTSSMSEATAALSKEVVPATAAIGNLKDGTGAYRRDQILYIAGRQSTSEDLAEKSAKVEAGIATARKHLSGAADRKAMNDFIAAWGSYLESTAGFVDVREGDITAGMLLLSDGAGDAAWEKTKETLATWDAVNTKIAKAAEADAVDAADTTRTTTILLLLAGVLVAGAAGTVVTRQIAGGLKRLVAAARGIAEGDVEQRVEISSRDELGDAAGAFGEMVDYLQESAAVADRIAGGDVSFDVTPRSERDALGTAFQGMTRSLRAALGEVAGSVTTVTTASQEMSGAADETGRAVSEIADAISRIAEGAEEQARQLEETRGLVHEMTEGVERSARTAVDTARAADDASEIVRDGVAAAAEATAAMSALRDSSGEVVGAIRELGAKSDEIGGIVETITGIAGQTNLLALNAAIEAARAGEQGRGFAVVAEEVRKLAEESQAAAASISQLIDHMQGETQKVVDIVERTADRTESGAVTVEHAREAFERIGGSVQDMGDRVKEIAAITERVAADATSVDDRIREVAELAARSSAATEDVSASTEQTSASAQEIAASTGSLASTAGEVGQIVDRFQLTA
jgi:methyl-accepting chemotaxis protein